MKMMMLISIMLSMNFLFMKHPLSMGSILLLQTVFSSLLCSMNLNSHFMSYILFLIFVGGMLILFMYMASIASNEKFYFSMKLMLTNISLFMLMMLINISGLKMQNFEMSVSLFNEYYNFFMNKLYTFPSGNITLLMTIYLLLALIIISNIIKIFNHPLRSN